MEICRWEGDKKLRCPKCNATVNDNRCLKHGEITVGGESRSEQAKLKEMEEKITEQKVTIEKLGEKLNEKKD